MYVNTDKALRRGTFRLKGHTRAPRRDRLGQTEPEAGSFGPTAGPFASSDPNKPNKRFITIFPPQHHIMNSWVCQRKFLTISN